MKKTVKTSAAEVKAKQKAARERASKTNGHAREPVIEDKDAAEVQAIADAVTQHLHVHGGRSPSRAIVEDLTDHRQRETRWTASGVNKALHYLAKEEQIVVEDDDETHVHLWTEDDNEREGHADADNFALEAARAGDREAMDPDDEDDEPEAAEAVTEDEEAPAGTEYLLHAFTDGEVLQKRLQREALDEKIDELVAKQRVAASEAASLRKEIEAMSKAGREITRAIKKGGDMRYVPCEPRKETNPDLPEEVVRKCGTPPAGELVLVTFRLDTNTAISWRPLKPIERQGQLWADAPAATRSSGVETREATTNLGDKLQEAGVTP